MHWEAVIQGRVLSGFWALSGHLRTDPWRVGVAMQECSILEDMALLKSKITPPMPVLDRKHVEFGDLRSTMTSADVCVHKKLRATYSAILFPDTDTSRDNRGPDSASRNSAGRRFYNTQGTGTRQTAIR